MAWFKFVQLANWKGPKDIKTDYLAVSFLKDNKVCFNIGGNKFRLIVKLNFDYSVVYIRFIGTHAQHDKIDANLV